MSTQFQFEQPPEGEDSGPAYLTKPGFYHVCVMSQNPEPTGRDGQYIDGLEVGFGVCAGTHPDQFDKTFDMIFVKGNANHSDGGKFCNRRLLKLFLATGMLGEHAPGQSATLDTAQMVGRQCIIEVELKKNSPGSRNPEGHHIELKFDCIYHVDDPAVKDVPKHPQLLAAIPANLRRDRSTFKQGPEGTGGAAGSGAPKAPDQPKPKLSVAQMLGAPAAAGSAAAAVDTSDV